MLHLTARAVHGFPLSDPRIARSLWSALRRSFPDTLACCLMGNHLHLLCPGEADRVVRALRRVLAARPGVWLVSAPKALPPTRDKIRRELRYILLNPCRAALTDDPLAWSWSTHRDVLGVVLDPWVPAERLAWLGSPAELHAYVSADPSVSVQGTPPPRFEGDGWPVPLGWVAEAALSSTRSPVSTLRRRSLARRVFLQLARVEGWDRPRELAPLCGIDRRSVHRAWGAPEVWRPARRALHDSRLRTFVGPPLRASTTRGQSLRLG